MRMQLYVPTAKAEKYSADDKYTWRSFQNALIDRAGGITVQTAFGSWKNDAGAVISEPVFIVEVLVMNEGEAHALTSNGFYTTGDDDLIEKTSVIMHDYAEQLIRGGEQAVLFVIDNMPVLLTEEDFDE